MSLDRAAAWSAIGIWNLKGESVGQDSSTAPDGDLAVGHGLSIEFQLCHSPAELSERPEPEIYDVLVIPVRLLEKMRGEEHPFSPHDFARFHGAKPGPGLLMPTSRSIEAARFCRAGLQGSSGYVI